MVKNALKSEDLGKELHPLTEGLSVAIMSLISMIYISHLQSDEYVRAGPHKVFYVVRFVILYVEFVNNRGTFEDIFCIKYYYINIKHFTLFVCIIEVRMPTNSNLFFFIQVCLVYVPLLTPSG